MLRLGGAPVIERVIERVSRVTEVDEIVVATTTSPEDAPLRDYVRELGVTTSSGPEADVLARYWAAARLVKAAHVVRITSDCPLLAPSVSSLVIRRYLDSSSPIDYCSNTVERTYPRGLDTEVFSIDALAKAHSEAAAAPDREHVTPYMYRHPDKFRVAQVTDTVDRSHHRWTLDTPDDLALIDRIYATLGDNVSAADYEDVLRVVERHPEWQSLNAHVQQKRYGE